MDNNERDNELEELFSLFGSMLDTEPERPNYTREDHERHLALYADHMHTSVSMLMMESMVTNGNLDKEHIAITLGCITDWLALSVYLNMVDLEPNALLDYLTTELPMMNEEVFTDMVIPTLIDQYTDFVSWYDTHIWVDD